eukprot:5818263-Amphidinium_carterae.1
MYAVHGSHAQQCVTSQTISRYPCGTFAAAILNRSWLIPRAPHLGKQIKTSTNLHFASDNVPCSLANQGSHLLQWKSARGNSLKPYSSPTALPAGNSKKIIIATANVAKLANRKRLFALL